MAEQANTKRQHPRCINPTNPKVIEGGVGSTCSWHGGPPLATGKRMCSWCEHNPTPGRAAAQQNREQQHREEQHREKHREQHHREQQQRPAEAVGGGSSSSALIEQVALAVLDTFEESEMTPGYVANFKRQLTVRLQPLVQSALAAAQAEGERQQAAPGLPDVIEKMQELGRVKLLYQQVRQALQCHAIPCCVGMLCHACHPMPCYVVPSRRWRSSTKSGRPRSRTSSRKLSRRASPCLPAPIACPPSQSQSQSSSLPHLTPPRLPPICRWRISGMRIRPRLTGSS